MWWCMLGCVPIGLLLVGVLARRAKDEGMIGINVRVLIMCGLRCFGVGGYRARCASRP